LNETRLRKPAPPLLDKLATPQKNTLCSFHFARAGFFLLKGKENFFAGFCSERAGRWGFASAGGQKFLPPDPLPFCPPAWRSLSRISRSAGLRGAQIFSAEIYKKGGWAGLEKFIAITLSFTPLENHLFTLLLVFSFIIII